MCMKKSKFNCKSKFSDIVTRTRIQKAVKTRESTFRQQKQRTFGQFLWFQYGYLLVNPFWLASKKYILMIKFFDSIVSIYLKPRVNIKIRQRYQSRSHLKLFMSCLFLISCPGLHQDLQASTPKGFRWSHYHGIWSSIRLLPGMYKIQILGGQ